jgi:hypothetical protein
MLDLQSAELISKREKPFFSQRLGCSLKQRVSLSYPVIFCEMSADTRTGISTQIVVKSESVCSAL